MSTLIALFLVLSTLAGCSSGTLRNAALPPPVQPPAVEYAVELETREGSIRDEDGAELTSYFYETPALTARNGGEEALDVCAAFNEPFSAWSENVQALADSVRESRAFCLENGLDFRPYTDELRCSVYQTERLVSVAGTYATYTGGAHSNTILLSWNFDLESGAFFDPAALDEEAGFHGAVVQALRTQAREHAWANGLKPADYYWEDYEDTLENWSSYAVSFDADGMTVGFSPYELASYAAGPQVFRIPYEELEDYLGSQGKALLGLE